jgi:Holliday junction resolvase RusA-like endonuclease
MTSLSFFVAGVVSAQGSKRHVGRGILVDQNANLQPWRDSICYAARQAGGLPRGGPVFKGPVRVTLAATYARPKSHYRTGRNAHLLKDDAPFYKTSAPDTDKVCRAALDAITASGLWHDDAQVAVLVANKRYVQQGDPGLAVQIDDLEEPTDA